MAYILTVLSNEADLLIVITTMLAMGLSPTVAQILEPLHSVLRVVLALLLDSLRKDPMQIRSLP